jgi:hypothetical protein
MKYPFLSLIRAPPIGIELSMINTMITAITSRRDNPTLFAMSWDWTELSSPLGICANTAS